jgi:demethylmenaquinone methyltransferase/2-methoxy-6-polyprenyl-1,4-benzoquinol methylase
MRDGVEQRLGEQVRYYRARAVEYDAWADRRGPYDRGKRNDGWFAEKQRLVAALDDFGPTGDVLEIACGTGQWTERLVRSAASLTVIDAAHETLEQNRQRLGDSAERISYHRADVFTWQPPQQYDVVFFSYWLSHVPPEYFEAFWERVAAWLKPDGRVFLIDNIATKRAMQLDPETPGGDGVSVLRPAPDGKLYRVWKVLWRPDELCEALGELGWSVAAYATGTYFLWAEGTRAGIHENGAADGSTVPFAGE